MKKFLLNSTAIVGLIASSVFADSAVPTSSLGGIVDFQAAFRDQEKEYEVNLSTNQKDVVFNNTARIYGKVEGKADAGFTYGAVVGLKANIETNRRDSSKIEKTYLYIESDMGRFEAGSNYSAAKTLKVDASTFARATGGISGDWYKYYNFANNANPIEASLKSAYNYFEENHYNHENFTDQLNKWSDNEIKKITYYSPRMSGFQVGVSYAPDAMNGKMPSTVLDPKNPTDSSIVIKDSYALLNQLSNNLGVKNLFSGGVNYTQQMDQMLVAISATGETAEVVNTTATGNAKRIKSYAIGANVGYAGFTVGGSYGIIDKDNFANNVYIDKSLSLATTDQIDDIKYWTLGAGYAQGPLGASVTYSQSKVKTMKDNVNTENNYKLISVGADYQLAQGMMPYVEATFVNPKIFDSSSDMDNKGHVILVGTQFQF